MAQTTRFASFGPILVITTHSNPIRRLEQSIKCIRTCNKYNILVKTLKKKKKRLTYGPNDMFCVVWARFGHRH